MGAFSQLKLTLWKHITIRKRQPIILLLEFLWPVIVFLIATSVRHIFPAEPKGDCAYKARALPSAGLLPFAQSFVCNLDNNCENISYYEEIPSYKNAKIVPLATTFLPIIQRDDVQDVLNHLSTTSKLATNLVKSFNNSEPRKVLSDSIFVEDLFKVPNRMQHYLINNLSMNVDDVKNLFQAKLNIGQLLRHIRSLDVKKLACQSEIFGSILEFPAGSNVEAITATICRLISDHPPDLVKTLVMNVNVRPLLHKVSVLLESLGSKDVAAALDGVGGIVDAFQDISILSSLASAPITADTSELTDYLQRAMGFINALQGFHLDFSLLGEIIDDIEQIAGPSEFISHLKVIGKHLHRLIVWSQHGILEGAGSRLTLADIAADGEGIGDLAKKETDLTEDEIKALLSLKVKPTMTSGKQVCYKICEEMDLGSVFDFEGTMSTTTLYKVYQWACGPDKCQQLVKEDLALIHPHTTTNQPTVSVDTIANDLKSLLDHAGQLTKLVGDNLKKYFPVFDILWKVGTTALSVAFLPEWNIDNSTFINSLASIMETLPGYLPNEMQLPVLNLVTASYATLTVAVVIANKSLEIDQLILDKLSKEPQKLQRVMTLGPEALTSLADVFTQQKTMDILLNRPDKIESLICNATLANSLLNHYSVENSEVLKEFLCDLPIQNMTETFNTLASREELVEMIEKILMANNEVDIDSAFSERVRSLVIHIWDLVQVVRGWKASNQKWYDLFVKLDTMSGNDLVRNSWKEVRIKFQDVKYSSILSVYSAVLGQNLENKKRGGRVGNVMTQVGIMINAITGESLSVPEEFLTSLANYWPSVIRVFLESLDNPHKARAVVSIRNWSEVICNATARDDALYFSTELNQTEFKDFFCNLTVFVEDQILGVNWFEKPVVKMLKEIAEDKLPSSKRMVVNWPETVQGLRKMLRRYSQFVSRSLDHAKEIEQLSVKVKEVFPKLNVTNIAKFSLNVVITVLEFVDKQLSTIYPWTWKQIKAFFSVLEMLADHANKEMEKIIAENKVEAGALAFNLRTVTTMARKIILVFPDIVNALADVLTNRLGDFIGRVFRVVREKKVVCDNASVTDVVDFTMTGHTNVVDMERFACDNWRSMMAEIIQFPLMFKLLWKFREASREGDFVIDWDKIGFTFQRLTNNADELTRFNGSVFPDVEGFTVEAADKAIGRLVHAVMINTTERGIRLLLLIGDALVPLAENVLKTGELTNSTNMAALLKSINDPELGMQERGEVVWFTFKIVMKTADILLKDIHTFFKKFKDDNVTLSSILGPTTLTNLFENFPDYVNTFIHSVLRPELPKILDRFKINGTVSFKNICEKQDLLKHLVVTPSQLQDTNYSSVMDTACKLLSEPFHYFALEPYIYSWAMKAADKAAMLWSDTDPRSVIVHFVDIMDGIEFLSYHVVDIVKNATDVGHYFENLVSSERWEIVGRGLLETVNKAQIDSWIRFLRTDLTSDDSMASKFMLQILNVTLDAIATGLKAVQQPGNVVQVKDLVSDNFPEIQKLLAFIENRGFEMFKILWHTSAVDPLKLKNLLESTNIWNTSCTSSLSSFLSMPTESKELSVTLQTLQQELCSIDVAKMLPEKEKNESIIQDRSTEIVAIADTIVHFVQELGKFRKRFPDSQLEWALLNSDSWKATVEQLEPKHSSTDGLQTVVSRMIDNVLRLEDGDGPVATTFKTLDRLVVTSLNTVEFMQLPLNESVWKTARKWYSTKPQVLTVINLLEDLPAFTASFMGTIFDPPKLYSLFKKFLTLAQGQPMEQFCQDLDLSVYLKTEKLRNGTLNSLRSFLCDTDWVKFAQDVNPYPLHPSGESLVGFNAVTFVLRANQLLQNMTQISKHSLPFLNADYADLPWINKNDWKNAALEARQFIHRIEDRHALINISVEYVSMVELIPQWSEVVSFFQLLNSQLSIALRHLNVLKDDKTLQKQKLYDVITNVQKLTQAVHQIHAGVQEAGDFALQFAFQRQSEYFRTYPNETSYFCPAHSSSRADASRLENTVKQWTNVDTLFNVFCKNSPSNWIRILTEDLKLSKEATKSVLDEMMTILPSESPWISDPRWTKIVVPFDWVTLVDSVETLNDFFRDPPTDFFPNYKWSAWQPVFRTFGEVLPLMISLSGETVCPTMPWINYQPFTGVIQVLHNQVLLAEEYERFLCDFPRMNLTAIYRRLKTNLKLVETLKQLRINFSRMSLQRIHEPNGRSETCPLLFNATAELADSLNDLIVDYVESDVRIQKIKDCFQEDTQAVVLKEIDKYLKLINKALPLMNLPNITSIGNSTELIQIVKTVLNYLKEQVPVYVPTRSILLSNDSLISEFSGSPSTMSLLDGSININRLAASRFIPTEMTDIFCDPVKREKLFVPPAGVSPQSIAQDIDQFLCENGKTLKGSATTRFLDAINWTSVENSLPTLQMRSLLSWNLIMSVGIRIGRLGNSLVTIKDVVGNVDVDALTNNVTFRKVLEVVLPLVYAENLTALSNGLEHITEDLQPLIHGSRFEEDLQQLSSGLEAIYDFMDKNYRNDTVVIKNFVKNLATIREFLLKTNMTAESADIILEGTFNMSVLFFDKKVSKLENVFCDTNILIPAFGLQSKYIVINEVYKYLCSPDMSISSQTVDIFLENINFMSIIKNNVPIIISGMANKAGVDPFEAADSLFSLIGAEEVVPILMKELQSLQGDPWLVEILNKLDPSKLAKAEISSPLITMAGNLVCGHSLPSFDEYFRLIQSPSLKPPEAKDREELQQLPSKVCQMIYQQIAYRPAGSLIWGFIKPFLKGKILYSPDTVLTQKIIKEANRTFDGMAQWIDKISVWANGFGGLGTFADEYLKTMENLLSLPLAQSVVVGLLGPNATSTVMNLSSTLEKMGNPQRLLGAASALGDGLHCFETNRFVPYKTEQELMNAAREHHKQGILMGGLVFLNLDGDHIVKREAVSDNTGDESIVRDPQLPTHIQYKIRMDIDGTPTTKRTKARFWTPDPEDSFIENMRYLRGFVEVQDMIDHAIIRAQTSPDVDIPGAYIQQFPYPCLWKDDMGYLLRASVPAITTLAWIFIIAFFIRELVLERETMMEQVMRVMGLKGWVNWLSWFISCVVVMIVTNVLIVLILKFGGVFPKSDFLVLLVLFLNFAFSNIMFCYLASVWFTKATLAALVGVMFFMIFFSPFICIVVLEAHLSWIIRIIVNLLMSTAFSYCCLYITRFEEHGVGIQWSNVWESPIPNDEMSFAWSSILLAADSVIYFVLATYLTAVFHAFKHSDRKMWYFVFWPVIPKTRSRHYGANSEHAEHNGNLGAFTVSLTHPSKDRLISLDDKSDKFIKGDGLMDDEYLNDNHSSKVGISLKNLRKVFTSGQSSETVAVEGLSLDFYEGQITTLLGQNGAGKTTTINMLTGHFPPHSGYATVYDKDIVYEFDDIRKNLGLCPQYNVLFDLMTVREHLMFFGKLKGIFSYAHLISDVDGMLHAMKLQEKQHELAKNLSGGMRRRLCVAIAFVGGSRTIILDEPTSGVDPVARRHIWNLLTRYKEGRTILLTTHHLDEADILSDRVAVIHEGKLLCCGSPLWLKRNFGLGYQLSINRTTPDYGSDSDSGAVSTSSNGDNHNSFNSSDIFNFIKPHISNVQVIEDHGNEMLFCLPYCADDGSSHSFDHFFLELEKHQSHLGIGSYGISCTTLEEVFMNVCLQADLKLPITPHGHKIMMMAKKAQMLKDSESKPKKLLLNDSSPDKDPLLKAAEKVLRQQESSVGMDAWLNKNLYQVHYAHLTGFALKWSQFKWLVTKRFHHFRRDWLSLVCCIILPCLLVVTAMGFTLLRPPVDPFSPSVLLSPSLYGPNANSFLSIRSKEDPLIQLYADSIVGPPGVGTSCMPDVAIDRNSVKYPACRYTMDQTAWNQTEERVQRDQCSCASAEQKVCTGRQLEFKFSKYFANSTDIIYNLVEGDNLTDWIMSTFDDFIERRYGGWSLGTVPSPLSSANRSAIAWFNNKGYHAMPSYLSSLNNAVLRGQINRDGKDARTYGISTFNHPLHLSVMQLGIDALLHHVSDIGIAFIFLLSFSFVPAGFLVYYFKQRIREEKRLQYLSGVGPVLYWSAAFFFDMITLFIPVALSALIIAIFDLPIYMYGHNFIGVIVILYLYGWATTPLMYIAEKFLNEASMASMIMYCVNVFIGFNTSVCVTILFLFQKTQFFATAWNILRYLFLIFPQFALVQGIIEAGKNYVQAEIFIRFGDDTYVHTFSMEIMGMHMIALALEGVVFFALNILLEYMPRVLIWIERRHNKLPTDIPVEDSDVKRERKKVQSKESEGDLMRLDSLYKVYQGVYGKTVAVDRVCLSIPRGECFGLLGSNGAGKTTIFRMLTGEIEPTYGHAFFQNKSISESISTGVQNIGYCPQVNALDDMLTAEELLSVYAGLRGIPQEDIPLAVYKAVVQFNLQHYARNLTNTYSCGTKRKACAAISVMGNPDIVLLDEPTSGMDPSTRRLVWNNVRQIVKEKRSVILTSHSMEECDTLCNRLAIMVNGRFRCLGSPQYLKHKFGDGYTITLRIHQQQVTWNEIYRFIQDCFPGSAIKVQHWSSLEFVVPRNSNSLGDIFSHLESAKDTLKINDFAVTQTTLDQVFVNFVQDQGDGQSMIDSNFQGANNGQVNLGLIMDDDDDLEAGNGVHHYPLVDTNGQLQSSDALVKGNGDRHAGTLLESEDSFQVTQF